MAAAYAASIAACCAVETGLAVSAVLSTRFRPIVVFTAAVEVSSRMLRAVCRERGQGGRCPLR